MSVNDGRLSDSFEELADHALKRARVSFSRLLAQGRSWDELSRYFFEEARAHPRFVLQWGQSNRWEECQKDPLHWAIRQGRDDLLVGCLLHWEGNPERAASYGLTRERCSLALLELTASSDSPMSEMARCAGVAAAVRLGADPDALGASGERALTACVQRAKTEGSALMLARFLTRLCDVSLPNRLGETPLSLACSLPAEAACYLSDQAGPYNALSLCQDLASRGADPNARGAQGEGPLRQAALAKNAPLCVWLAEQGADPAARCAAGLTHEQALEKAGAARDNPAFGVLRALRERVEIERSARLEGSSLAGLSGRGPRGGI